MWDKASMFRNKWLLPVKHRGGIDALFDTASAMLDKHGEFRAHLPHQAKVSTALRSQRDCDLKRG